MFDLVNGLPVHPLVVHAVVVLLPLACIGTIALALRPRWRGRYGVLVVGCATVATVLLPVATSSGEALEEHVGSPGEHAELGDQLIWFALPLLVLSAALVWLDRRQRLAGADGGDAGTAPTAPLSSVARVVAALAVVAAVADVVPGVPRRGLRRSCGLG